MKKTVVLYKNIPPDQVERLAEHFNVIRFDGVNAQNRHQFLSALGQAQGLIGVGVKIDTEMLDVAPYLKAISTISVGYDNFDTEELTRRNIRLMHTPTVLTDTTADAIFALLMASARRVVEMDKWVRDGHWQGGVGHEFWGVDIHHKTIGIIGMGRIGRALAKRAFCGFDMPVLYHSNRRHQEVEQQYAAQYGTLDEVLQRADFVCLTVPLSAATEKLISQEKLRLMKPSAILINGARGKVVDQAALAEALQQKTIRAAGLDVFEVEPLPSNSPLLTLDNVILLPHIASATGETRYNMAKCAVDNLINALKAEKPSQNWVNPMAG